jgi:hypothetical protein
VPVVPTDQPLDDDEFTEFDEVDDELLNDELLTDESLDDELTNDDLEDPAALVAPVSDPVGTARRKHGGAGAILAAGMFGLDIALGRKPKEDAPIVVTASGEPGNIDDDGIEIPIDDTTSVYAPPQPPVDPFPPRRKRR